MYAVNSALNNDGPLLHSGPYQKNGSTGNPKTTEIRVFLTSLRMRPLTEREFLCRLLKRAAAQASTKDSAVHLADSPHPK